ncbi:hypothetical protein [Polynucleobacter sp. MWH-UH2A]|uniref:hypothetical protein n=1 Tax=Polynucleobacter sp. MWH-UH2A TaxID=1855617 RepID=UPI001BFD0493|nr:hypothetical protein [Polynucleobacter sp. MWH-UH2A]QWD64675.1 hypothetical protein IC571_03320 [Polynucleobacter sp. MWH-UH2A]
MGQKEVAGKLPQTSESFVELHIEDLVKDRLLWQAQIGRRAYPNDNLPSVIHIVESTLTAIR